MTAAPELTISTVNIGSSDAGALARFYQRLLSGRLTVDEPGWAMVKPAGDGVALAFQSESPYVPPVWPTTPDQQQMMLHLEIRVTDLEAATAHALECGATLAEFQPQDDVRVCLDPAGHPFCLWVQ